MKTINQAKDWSVCLFGETLPKYSLYGKVCGTVWYCKNWNKITITGNKTAYEIYAYNPKTGRFNRTDTTCKKVNGGAIYLQIRQFMASDAFNASQPEPCEFRNWKRTEEFRQMKKAEADHARSVKRAEQTKQREFDEISPQMRKVNYNYIPMDNTRYELSKQNKDNCDMGGGGDAVMRHDHKDSITRCNMSLQYVHESERKITIYDVKRIETAHHIIWVEETERLTYTERTDKNGTTIKK